MADQGLAEPSNNIDTSIDGAAQAIQALLARDANPQPAPEPTPEPAPQASEPEPEITSEAAPEGDTPVVTAEAEAPQEQPTQAQTVQQPVIQAQQPAVPDPNIAARSQQLNQLNQLVPQLQGQLAALFPDIRSLDDLARVATEDPARALAYQVQERRLQVAQQYQQALHAQQRSDWERSEAAKLEKLIPDIADPQKGPELKNKILKFAREQGYTDQQIALAGAADVALLHEAMMYRASVAQKAAEAKAQAKKIEEAKNKAKDAPPVQKPGTARSATSKDEKARGDFERLQKTGRIDDAARVFRHLV